MIRLKKENLNNLSKIKKLKLIKRIASFCTAASLTIFLTGCEKNVKKNNVLTSETGELYLVDVLNDEKKISIKDPDGNKLNYKFTEDTKAIVGSKKAKTEKGIDYGVILVDNIGNVTYGYMDGEYLSDTYLDFIKVNNTKFTTYYVSSDEGAILVHNADLQKNREISTLLDSNVQVVGSINSEKNKSLSEAFVVYNNKFLHGFINKNDLSLIETINEDVDSYDDEVYNTDNIYVVNINQPLNVRKDANINAECIDSLSYGTEVEVVDGVQPKIDDERKWVYIKFESTETNEVTYGWVAKEIFATNEYYIIEKSSFVDDEPKINTTENNNLDNGRKNYFSINDEIDYDSILAQSAIVYNGTTGQIFFSKNMTEERQPASITKILSAYIVYKYGNLDDYITYSNRAVDVDGHSNEGYGVLWRELDNIVKEGNKISVKDALHISLILSDNCTTIALEEYIESITGRNFIELMNEEVKNIGCKDTYFTNSFGYEDPNHTTTALDMGKIMRYVVNNGEELSQIMGKKYYVLESYKEVDGTDVTIYHTIGTVVDTNDFYNKYAFASKSGYHDAAGWTLATAYEKDDNKYIIVTMGNAYLNDAIIDSENLADSFDFGANDISLENNKVLGLN